MKKVHLYVGILLATSISFLACHKNVSETYPQEATATETSPTISPQESMAQEASAESQAETDSTEIPYSLSDSAKKQLTDILTDAFFFGIGHDQKQKFSDLTFENSNLGILLYTTLFDVEGARLDQNEPSRIHVSKKEVRTYLQDCFGIDIGSLKVDDFLEEADDDYAIVANDPFGSDIPDLQINTVTQDTTTGIITLTGDAWIVPCDYLAAFSTFTVTMIASDSSYFDGHTLLTFECHENNTDNHPTIDYSRYGYYDGYNPESKATQ